MSEPSIDLLNLLPHYQVPPACYDELARGQIPPHWQDILAFFTAPGDLAEALQP